MSELLDTSHCTECAFRSLLFDKLDFDELLKMDASKSEVKYLKGEEILIEGDKIKEFVYLKNGLVKLSKMTENNRDHIISIAKPKTFIGFLTVFSHDTYQYTITALEESTLCFIDIAVVKNTIRENGTFALDVLSKISQVSDEIINRRVNICSKQLRGRIAYLLISFSKEIYYNTKFELPLTRKEFGELIDMSTENVIRILSEFRKDELINIDGSKIEIINFESLNKISRFG
ncbi:MAG: Crp/Fnr family transcriptional regulator [Cyclobacteriaceae bacterium]|nr:Crp/Fnr family transcriptional regulator [Cyclobacteriaceae bacterium]MCK5277348.1 Crp/Fnr family transcriptional regulator [Cyclobacteriaceae bacterium]MCK5467076.1 Crp/Fnr family transcriptional regulator [Cyclobacteriaceae bacterium]